MTAACSRCRSANSMTCSKASTCNAGVLDRRQDPARTQRMAVQVALWAPRDRVLDVQGASDADREPECDCNHDWRRRQRQRERVRARAQEARRHHLPPEPGSSRSHRAAARSSSTPSCRRRLGKRANRTRTRAASAPPRRRACTGTSDSKERGELGQEIERLVDEMRRSVRPRVFSDQGFPRRRSWA